MTEQEIRNQDLNTTLVNFGNEFYFAKADASIRKEMKIRFEELLSETNSVSDYAVVCKETNNKDFEGLNQVRLDIVVQFVGDKEFIYFPITLDPDNNPREWAVVG